MTLTTSQLDSLPAAEAAFKLAACCGSTAWVAGMLAFRPFCTSDNVFAAAEEVAGYLTQTDWLEAFSHHPRIGGQNAVAAVSSTAATWSSGEQFASSTARGEVQAALAVANAEYEQRYGFVFIVCADGRSAEEILHALRARLRNERDTEIDHAAHEQRQITRLRLEKLLSGTGLS
jgi:OHCU decarboxylase